MTDAHGYYRIETFYAYGHKQKVRTKEKMEVRDRVDNSQPQESTNRKDTSRQKGVQCPVPVEVSYIVLYNSIVFFDYNSLFNSS